jgi:anthranilate synthase component II
MNVLILDNYDSFTFNLYQYVGELLRKSKQAFVLDIYKNDEITLSAIRERGYDRIIISPGSGDPRDSTSFGVCREVISTLGMHIPILGVCLGMQGIVACFGGKIVAASKPMHGKISTIRHNNAGIFTRLPQLLSVMRYHSLLVEKNSLPDCFSITAWTTDIGEIMGVKHKQYPIEGVQFHPESFATMGGKQMLEHFIFD